MNASDNVQLSAVPDKNHQTVGKQTFPASETFNAQLLDIVDPKQGQHVGMAMAMGDAEIKHNFTSIVRPQT